jgi:hypothetical protein
MPVQVQLLSVESLGTTTTARGEEQGWNVKFSIDYRGKTSFYFSLSLQITGPAGVLQAEELAYAELRNFFDQGAAEVAKGPAPK